MTHQYQEGENSPLFAAETAWWCAMTHQYQEGEIVDITISGARVLAWDGRTLAYQYTIADADGEPRVVTAADVRPDAATVTITRIVPAAGMPKPGEVWQDTRGVRWLAVAKHGEVRLHDGRDSGAWTVAEVHDNYGPLVPVLRDEDHTGRITPQIAQHVLWHYGAGGYEPGSFSKLLIELIVRADPVNRRRLAAEYGGHVAAVALAEGEETGIATLRQIAGGAS